MRLKGRVLALAFVAIIIGTCLIMPQEAEAAWDRLELVPSKYTGTNIYAPGETLNIVLHASDDDVYDVSIELSGSTHELPRVTIGPTETEKVTYDIPVSTPDGAYFVVVELTNGDPVNRTRFYVQGYEFNIETDRSAYLRDDDMRVFWTANNIKDQTLPPNGYGILRFWSHDPATNVTSQIDKPVGFNSSAGSTTFSIPTTMRVNWTYWVDGWFNSSDSITYPSRVQYSKAEYKVRGLGVILDIDKEQYGLGSLLNIDVKTVATNNTANPSYSDTAEPEVDITISVLDYERQYMSHIEHLKTDSHGSVNHIVYLDPGIYDEGAEYTIEVNAAKGQDSIKGVETIMISATSSIAVVIDFDKSQYTSGDTISLTATASSIGAGESLTFTYIMEVRDTNVNGSLFSRVTQTTGSFSFNISLNFEGFLWVRVTADDGLGNSASVVHQVQVAYAIVLVNVDREYYVANEEMSISYEVVSSIMSNTSTFYEILDFEGNTVEMGNMGKTMEGSFSFTVPAAPSKRYVFKVYAVELGRMVHGTDSAVLFSGYVLLIDFNRNSYEPGDTMAIDYELLPLGDAVLPASFTITYGLTNGPTASLQTSQSRGTLLYTIPDNVDQGDQLFWASSDFGGTVNQVVSVRSGANPLWYLTVKDIPIFDALLFLLILLAFYMMLRFRRQLKELRQEKLVTPSKPAEPGKRPAPESSGMTTECVECGNPIEVTTTRRPIEVMCPHCGEIQFLEK